MVWKIRLGILGFALLMVVGALTLLMNFHAFSIDVDDYACEVGQLVDVETGQVVVGAEDIVLDIDNDRVLISAYDRFAVQEGLKAGGPIGGNGGIYAVPLSAFRGGGDVLATRLETPDIDTNNFRPHGIDLYRGADGTLTLYAVNRQYTKVDDGEWALRPVIERFRLGGTVLSSTGLYRSSVLCGPNDIAALDADRFFVTNDHGACTPGAQFIEEALGQSKAFVMYYDGAQFHRVAEGIGYANGIALIPDAETLLISATREDAIRAYRMVHAGVDGPPVLFPEESIPVPGAPDNLVFGSDGNIWVAYFPNIYRFAAYRGGWFGIDSAPAAAGVLSLPYMSDEGVATAYEGAGADMSGSTAAIRINDALVVISGFDHRIVLCGGLSDI